MMRAELPGADPAMYDRVNEKIGIGPENPPEGLISQAGQTDSGMLIVDVRESQEAFERFFAEQVSPVLEQIGAPPVEPRFFPVHNHIPKGRGERAGVILVIETEGFAPDDCDGVIAKMEAHRGDGSNHPALSHVAGLTDRGMIFVDVWDSPRRSAASP